MIVFVLEKRVQAYGGYYNHTLIDIFDTPEKAQEDERIQSPGFPVTWKKRGNIWKTTPGEWHRIRPMEVK